MTDRASASPSPLERVLEALVAAFAAWTLLAQATILLGGSFALLTALSPIALLLALGLLWSMRSFGRVHLPEPVDAPRPARSGPVSRLLGALAVVLLLAWSGSYLVFWLGAIVLLAWSVLDGPVGTLAESEPDGAKRDLVWLGLLAALVVAATLISHRTDSDDSFYLNVSVSALDHPERALFAQDEMFGESGLPLLAPVYRVQTYELLVALVAKLGGLELKTVYYLLLPALSAALVVLASWLALRELAGGRALFGAAVVAVVLLTWGDRHAGHGGFAFVRLFQGKAVLVAVGVPVVLYATARFLRRRDVGSWILLALAQVASVGASANGMLVAPAVAAPLLLGGLVARRSDVKLVALGALASLYVVVVGAAMVPHVESLHALLPARRAAIGTEANLLRVIGDGLRGQIALFALIAVPAIPADPARARRLAGWALAIVLLWLNPFASDLLARVARSMDWRIFWAVPFPLLIGLVALGLTRLGRQGALRFGAALAAILVAGFVLAAEPWTLSPGIGTRLGAPDYKVSAAHAVAEAVVAETPAGGLVLAPWSVASWIPTLHGHPRLVEVRAHYLRIIALERGMQEARSRRILERSVDLAKVKDRFTPPGLRVERRLPKIVRDLKERGVTTIVLERRVPWRDEYVRLLSEAGFEPRELASGRYELWVLSESAAKPESD